MSAVVKTKDNGAAKLVKTIKSLQKTQLRIGVLEGDVPAEGSEGVTIGQVATWNEFGTDRIPERSFIRGWYDSLLEQHKAQFREMMRLVKIGTLTEEQSFLRLGLLWQAEIQKRISESKGWAEPNASSTVARKGSDVPLIDTGQLRKAISFVVEHGDL